MKPEREELSVTAASTRGIARLVADAAHGGEVVVTRHGSPVAAVVGIEHLEELDRLRDDLRDLALVIGRTAGDDGRRTQLDDVVDAFRARRRTPLTAPTAGPSEG
jgi:prevent-host-death family protein